MTDNTPGLMIAAPASGLGKTTVMLGLLRALQARGYAVSGAKLGPDYIDTGFHSHAARRPAYNLDPWAMRPESLQAALSRLTEGADLLLIEGAMGLFDGIGPAGLGSSAELAALYGWPVVLVLDARGASASLAATLNGFARHHPDVTVAGVIINRVASIGHADVIADACRHHCPEIALLGCLPRDPGFALPERHLGLVQAAEHPTLDPQLDRLGRAIASHLDLALLCQLARPARALPASAAASPATASALPPLGQRIAIASDPAFAFHYRLILEQWQAQGAELIPFSPLADEMPDAQADAVYLPGGYPELHAGRLSGNRRFLDGLRRRAQQGATIYGECGGYMALGDSLTDSAGVRHAMAGLLPFDSSFAAPRLSLGYRQATTLVPSRLGPAGSRFTAHEFHYCVSLREDPAAALFATTDGLGQPRPPCGLAVGRVMGSYLHLIDSIP